MKIPKCVILKSYLHCNETVKLLIWIKMGASFLAEAGRNLFSGLKMTLIPLSYAVLCPLELLCPLCKLFCSVRIEGACSFLLQYTNQTFRSYLKNCISFFCPKDWPCRETMKKLKEFPQRLGEHVFLGSQKCLMQYYKSTTVVKSALSGHVAFRNFAEFAH